MSSRARFYDAFRRYLAEPGSGAVAHAAEFQEKVRASDMRYAGEPLDVAYFPVALGAREVAALARAVERVLALLEGVTRRFLESPRLQAEYGWSAERLRVVRHDPGYDLAIPCARLDSYWDGAEGLRFLEVNTDGTSGMTNVERVTAFFLESPGLEAVCAAAGARLENFPLRDDVLGALLRCWEEFRDRRRPRAARDPRVAIVDWRTVKTSAEFRALVSFMAERGLRATIADPRDLRYEDGVLRDARGEGEPIDLIYRRVVSTEYFAAPAADTAAMTRAYLDGAVCVVGSFRSDVAFDKRIMALLTDPELAAEAGIGAEDRAFLERCFPRTRTLRRGPVLEDALARRADLVLKPCGLYEGRGVRIGLETDDKVWRAALEEAAAAGDHVVQERERPPELTIELIEDGRWRPRPLYLSLGEYVFGGRFIGCNARVASTLVLSADDDERILPVVRLGAA